MLNCMRIYSRNFLGAKDKVKTRAEYAWEQIGLLQNIERKDKEQQLNLSKSCNCAKQKQYRYRDFRHVGERNLYKEVTKLNA